MVFWDTGVQKPKCPVFYIQYSKNQNGGYQTQCFAFKLKEHFAVVVPKESTSISANLCTERTISY